MTFILVSLIVFIIGFALSYLMNSSFYKKKRIIYSILSSLVIYFIVFFSTFHGVWGLALSIISVGLLNAFIELVMPEVQ